jgi:carbamoylphosphate synthase large subunit
MAEQFKSAGQRLRIPVQIFSFENELEVPIAEFAQIIIGGSFSDDNTFSELVQIIEEKKIDILIPFHDSAVRIASVLNELVFSPVSGRDAVEIFSNKKKTADFLRRNCFPTPNNAVKAPAIAKPVNGSSSIGIIRMDSDEQFSEFVLNKSFADFEVQEICEGPELSVDGYVALNGNFSMFVPRVRQETINGEVLKSRTIRNSDVTTICAEVCKIAKLSGALTFQFIWSKRAQAFLIMEVNLRFGGGVLTSILAGVPWPEIVIRDYLGVEQGVYQYDDNFLMVRSYREFGFSMKDANFI